MDVATHSIVTTVRAADPRAGKATDYAVASPPLPTDIDGGMPGGADLLHAAKLTVPQAATRMGIGETKMREIIRSGGVPVIRILNKTMLLERDLEEYLCACYGRTVPVKQRADRMPPLPQHVRESPWLGKGT